MHLTDNDMTDLKYRKPIQFILNYQKKSKNEDKI